MNLWVLLWISIAQAQIDPSSAILLRGGTSAPQREQLDSGRYRIRPTDPVAPVPQPAPKAANPVVLEPKKPASQPVAPVEAPAPVETVTPAPQPENVGERVEKAILGGSPEQIDEYREQLHPDDRRHNMVEIDFAPTYVYVDANSVYWPRAYSFNAPGVYLGAQIWVTPFFGLKTSFLNSLDGSIYKSPASADKMKADQQWFEVGLRWRKFFGLSRRAAHVAFGIDYSEQQLKIPNDSTDRNRNKTVGAKILFEATMPTSRFFAWQSGVSLQPRADHNEFGTAATFDSGERDQVTAIGAWLGAAYTMDRSSQFYWRVHHTVEKIRFEGPASAADPVTGATPEGVDVTTGFTRFSIGYRWGY